MTKLSDKAFWHEDETPDALFYREPRFVTHIDEGAIAAVSALYRGHFAPGTALLDLMSSGVSHLPEDVRYRAVVGLGLNARELAANPRLDRVLVQDLNVTPALPFRTRSFDGAARPQPAFGRAALRGRRAHGESRQEKLTRPPSQSRNGPARSGACAVPAGPGPC